MTLRDTIIQLAQVAARQPSVQMIVENDVYKLNELQNVRYGVFAFTEGRHPVNLESSEDEYRLTLFYVDRLREDERNRIEIHSTGMQTLANILRTLQDADFVVPSYTVQPFDQRFKDNCSGVFAEVILSSLRSNVCPEIVEFASILPPSLSFDRLGGSETIQVVSTTPWRFVGEIPDWMTIEPLEGCAGTTDVTITVKKNPAFEPVRDALFIVESKVTGNQLASLHVYQDEGFAVFVEPETLYFGWNDTAPQTLRVTANAEWKIVESPRKASIDPTSGTDGESVVSVSYPEINTGIDRAAVIVFECGDATATVQVEREGLREIFDDADGDFLVKAREKMAVKKKPAGREIFDDADGDFMVKGREQIWVIKQKYYGLQEQIFGTKY